MRAQLFLILTLFLSACAIWPAGSAPAAAVLPTPDPARPAAPPAPIPQASTNRRAVVEDSPRYGLTLGFDAIRPVYEPRFISPSQSKMAAEEMVIGVAWGGEAKAYPIAVLNLREMVNDELAGVPTLVSW